MMKKLIALLLALTCLFAIVSCDDETPDEGNNGDTGNNGNQVVLADFSKIVENSKPTKVTTFVDYGGVDNLKGRYVTLSDGNGNSSFSYEYQRYATIAESNADGRIKTVKGVTYFKDGEYYKTEGDALEGDAVDSVVSFSLRMEADKFKTLEYSENGNSAVGTLSASDTERVLGVSIDAKDVVTVEITTNGNYVYAISISYTTQNGANVLINTTYDYVPVVINLD